MPQAISDQAIKCVHVVSTGSAAQHKEHRYGSQLPQLWWVLTSRSWIDIPINAFVIEHRDGLILFDTGLDPAIMSDKSYISQAIGRFLLPRIFKLHIGPKDALGCKLNAIGIKPVAISKVVVSHLHFDHVGGIQDVPQADLLVGQEEWNTLSEPHPEHEWKLREHIEITGAKWCPIEFAATDDPLFAPFGGIYDIMGDGSMILLPTPGHTPGSLSLLLRNGNFPPLLLVGDLTYQADLLMKDQVPGTGDAAQLRASFAKVRALKKQLPDLIILASHDPKTAELVETSDWSSNGA